MKRLLSLAACLLVPQGSSAEPFARALADYRAARYDAAWVGFREVAASHAAAAPAERVASAPAPGAADPDWAGALPPELRSNLAVTALRRSRPADAEAVIRPLLTQDDPAERAEAEFVLGMAALRRGELAAAAAQLPDAEPMAWQAAVDGARRAVDHFARAGERADGWPAAWRNAERSWRLLQAWQQLRDQHRQQKQHEDAPPPPPAPTDDQPQEEQLPDLAVAPLTARELAELAQKLARKEREKRAARRLQQAEQTPTGARGW